jgi:hypothetical protein
MRLVLLPLAPLLVAATVAPNPPASPSAPGKLAVQSQPASKNCRGRMETVRAERGLPRLAPDTGVSPDPLLILAVDRQIDGCEVLVMWNNLNDIRPLPAWQDKVRKFPAK